MEGPAPAGPDEQPHRPRPAVAEAAAPPSQTFLTIRELQARLDKLERRDWFLWWAVVVVMLLLTTAVVSLSFPELLADANPFSRLQLSQSVRALVGLVLIFCIYTVFQHLQVRRLRGQIAAQMAQIGELEMRAEQFYSLAVRDHLTGLYNRRFADERLAVELRRAQRHGLALTVVMLDLDNFKQLNDRHGHAAGDTVLREFATRLKQAIRSTDLAARVGGDEFMVLLPECPGERAQTFLDRLASVVVELNGRSEPIELSAGWASFEKGDTPESLLERADRTLYKRKRKSKVTA